MSQETPSQETILRWFEVQRLLGRPMDKKYCILIKVNEGDWYSNVDTPEEANAYLQNAREKGILNEASSSCDITKEMDSTHKKMFFYADGDKESSAFGFNALFGEKIEWALTSHLQ